MNTIDNLVIRACKSDTDISKRLVSLYKRFYIKPIPKNIDTQLCELLFNICEKHCPVSGQRLHKLIQEKVYHYSMYDTLKGESKKVYEYEHYCKLALASHIKFTEAAKFVGYRPPLWFKNFKNEMSVLRTCYYFNGDQSLVRGDTKNFLTNYLQDNLQFYREGDTRKDNQFIYSKALNAWILNVLYKVTDKKLSFLNEV